jgi:primosomal protein N' (replication factor Y)
MNPSESVALVAVDVPLFTTLSYVIPDALHGVVRPGQLVQVPFRNRSKTGLVMNVVDRSEVDYEGKLRGIVDVVDREPLLGPVGLKFLEFVAEYYMSPVGEVVKMAVPSAARTEGVKRYAPLTTTAPEGFEDVWELFGQEPVSVAALKEATGRTFAELSELEVEHVEVSYADTGGISVKTDRFYRIVREPEEGERLGSKQTAILDLLSGSPDPMPLAEIRDAIDAPHSSLNSLEEREIVTWVEEEVYRDPFAEEAPTPVRTFDLTEAQLAAVEEIRAARLAGTFAAFLLHGVTGSGKTEVYVRIIRETLESGRRALVLLPEIALTPQFVGVFRGHFGDDIAVLHSGLSPAQKFDQWRRIARDEVGIVIGARSAIFAPVNNLGILVVDEEHDPSFKQEDGPRYNARDLALMRGKLEGAQVVLGSATPSLESYQNAKEGRLSYLAMPDRVAGRPLPTVELVDLKGVEGVVTPQLESAVRTGLEHQHQAIFFLNRRGYSPCVICDDCGHVWECPNCAVSLTYHRRQEALRCHHCDHALRLPESCPSCGAEGLGPRGVGTEQLEALLRGTFADARIGRLDRDTGKGGGLRRLIAQFRAGEIDLLVGTQMVTKGHDFPSVTTVGVVMADLGLNFPDFRAAERTFQLLTQVAGRAGRGDDRGRVYVQSYNPEHYALQASVEHDYMRFAARELKLRDEMGYPPFGYLIAVKFEARSEAAVHQAARDYAFAARRRLRDERYGAVMMLGPALAPIERLRGRTRWQLLFKSRDRSALRRLVGVVLNDVGYFDAADRRHKNVRIAVDVDPLSLL